jgi:hypothetical protein
MLRKSLLSLLLAAAFGAAQADTLLLEGIQASEATADSRPKSGATMEQVEARYGMPTEKVAPVGDPPIARWEYPGFTVFFEYDRVIHAVARH